MSESSSSLSTGGGGFDPREVLSGRRGVGTSIRGHGRRRWRFYKSRVYLGLPNPILVPLLFRGLGEFQFRWEKYKEEVLKYVTGRVSSTGHTYRIFLGIFQEPLFFPGKH